MASDIETKRIPGNADMTSFLNVCFAVVQRAWSAAQCSAVQYDAAAPVLVVASPASSCGQPPTSPTPIYRVCKTHLSPGVAIGLYAGLFLGTMHVARYWLPTALVSNALLHAQRSFLSVGDKHTLYVLSIWKAKQQTAGPDTGSQLQTP